MAAGRAVKTIQNYVDGDPDNDGDSNDRVTDEDVTIETTYTPDGLVATYTATNAIDSDGDGEAEDVDYQTTTYVYGSALGGITPAVYRTDLLRAVIYPDSDDTPTLGNGQDTLYDRVEYQYSIQGEQIELKDQNQTVHEYIFDGLGRLLHDRVTGYQQGVIDTTILRITRGYEVRGMLNRVTSFNDPDPGEGTAYNDVFYLFNDFGQMTRDYQRHNGEIQFEGGEVDDYTPYVAYTYAGPEQGLRLESVQYPHVWDDPQLIAGRLVHYTYGTEDGTNDVLNRLEAICDDDEGEPGPVIAQYTYLGLGTIVTEDYVTPEVTLDYIGDGSYSGFDQFGRVVDQVWEQVGQQDPLDRYTYEYDFAGNRTERNNERHAAFDEVYTYDDIDRLITSARADDFDQSWTLDGTGNFSEFDDDGDEQTREHNEVNEIDDISGDWATPVYDAAGNMTTVPVPLAGDADHALTCTFDAWNRVVTVKDGQYTVGQYGYDGLGRRILKAFDADSPEEPDGVIDGYYHIFLSGQQVIDTRYTASPADPEDLNPTYQFVWSPRYIDALISRDENTNDDTTCTGTGDERLYYTNDANFNVTALVGLHEGNWEVVERYVYAPYGKFTVLEPDFSPDANNLSDFANTTLYTGRELDRETTFLYYRYRIYSLDVCTFLSRDPVYTTPNLYAYCGNAPTGYVDPSGLAKLDKDTSPGALKDCEIVLFLGHHVPTRTTPANADAVASVRGHDQIEAALVLQHHFGRLTTICSGC